MTPEARIQREIMLALSEAGCLVWRNNTGQAWQGKQVHKSHDQITLAGCRPVNFGLMVGSADLIGVSPGGKFLAVEAKAPSGRVSDAQCRFLLAVNRAGGIGFVARSAEDALKQLEERLHAD